MDKDFVKDVNRLYAQLREIGDRAREIIRKFVESNDGRFVFDTKDDDMLFVGEERYATELEIDSNGNIVVFNSEEYSEYLEDMMDENILEIAVYCANNIDK